MITGFFPGRIRLRAPVFKDTAITERALSILKAPALSSIIKEIEHNPVTGSVLITYHPTKVPIAKLRPLLPFFKKLEKEAHVYKLSGRTGDDISKNAKALLDAAFKAGFEGIEIDKIKLPQARKEARDLIKLGKLICLENFLHYHTDFYKKAVNSLFAKYKTGDKISIADAREVTGLSRKYILPILNLLEKEGKLKRQDNDRIVL